MRAYAVIFFTFLPSFLFIICGAPLVVTLKPSRTWCHAFSLEAQGHGDAGEASPISEIPDRRIRSDVAAMRFSRSADLPGGDLIEAGLDDLRQHRRSVAALLVSIGAPRLRQLGLRVPRTEADPERCLYELLARSDPDSAHGRYNALVRRLVSFERAAACVS